VGLPVFFIMCVCTAAEKLEQAESQLAHSNRLGGGFLMMSAKKKDVSTHLLDAYVVKASMVLGFVCKRNAEFIKNARCQLFSPASGVLFRSFADLLCCSQRSSIRFPIKSGDAPLDPGECCGKRQLSNLYFIF
jgi:hypothetical protein